MLSPTEALERRVALFACTVLLAAAAQLTAHANDGVMGGSGADLVPMKTTDVRMASEDIVITAAGDEWLVDASYLFRNGTERDVTLQLGFPEFRCEQAEDEGDCVDAGRFRFEDMRTEVRGQIVPHRKGRIRKHAWAPRLGTVWLFDVTFRAHEEVPVRHRYRVASGYMSDGSKTTRYVTRTGALWAGPIGRARFAVRVPVHTTEWYGPDEDLGRPALEAVKVDDKQLMQVSYELRDFAPTGDLFFGYLAGHVPAMFDEGRQDFAPEGPKRSGLPADARCADFLRLWNLGYALADERYKPSEEQVETVLRAARERGGSDARICKNTVFAIYGRRFENEQLNRYFYGERGFVPGTWPYGLMEPNPFFDTKILSAGDWKTIELAQRLPAITTAELERSTDTATAAPQTRGCGAARNAGGDGAAWLLALLVLRARRL